jgi:hypothetical protein
VTTIDPYDPGQKHADPAVEALIKDGWLGIWDHPIEVEDLENAVRLVRSVDASRKAG